MRRLLLLTGAIVFFDTLFFAALTPLLPHYAHALGIGKTGAGVLAAAYPAGALVGAIPSGVVAARFGVKRTVLVGLCSVAACTILFGFGVRAWQLDAARFVQGLASAFSWTGALAWLVAAAPVGRRGALIGQAFAAAVGGALFGPVLGGIASLAGTGWTFAATGGASLALAVWAASTPAARPEAPQPLRALPEALRDRRMAAAFWFVVLPALLFGALSVLAPLRLSHLGFGSVAIGAVFLCTAAVEAVNNVFVGHLSDRRGPAVPIVGGLAGSLVLAALLPWPTSRFALAALVVLAGLAFGTFYTPAMTLLTQLSERRGLDYGYTFALVSLAWAPGQTLGAAGGGALAHAVSDAATYLVLAAVCALTLLGSWRTRTSIGSTTPSAPASSASSSRTTAAA
ncbi:MAG TPA: MFS transporter [Gaiellaceae bacterium]|nr:MFS transporter [Gaiellaceae bacterium]